MIRICHAFASLMNQYGDYANVALLARRLEEAGEEVLVTRLDRLHGFDAERTDFLFIGAGTEGAAAAACRECAPQRDALLAYAQRGGLALLTGTAPALFGQGIEAGGTLAPGIGFLDAFYRVQPGRRYSEFLLSWDETAEPVVGSVSTTCRVEGGQTPWFSVDFDAAGILSERTEGMREGGVFATQLSGPLLVRNPSLLDWFAARLAGRALPAPAAPWNAYARAGYESVRKTLQTEKERAV